MVRCLQNEVLGSLVLDRSTHAGSRLWSSFSAASFRRRIIHSMRCGGGASCRRASDVAADHLNPLPDKPQKPPPVRSESGSEKLSDLLNLSSSSESESCSGRKDDEIDVKRKVEKFDELSKAVKLLQREEVEERENGAKLVRRLAKEDAEARNTIAMLGAIPPLVAMVDDNQIGCEFRVEALYALLNLGIGNDLNKAAIVQAGAVHKMLKMIETSDGSLNSSISEAIVANFLALSALDSNKPIIGSSGAIPFLVNILKGVDKQQCGSQAKQDSLRALYNLSILPSNIPLILETHLIQFLIDNLGEMDASERILAILSNVVASPEGRKALGAVPDAFPTLIDVLNWTDSPGCQEKASYILMVMAYKAYNDRSAMVEAGIVSALLELTLVGSTLAQKRASRILEYLRVDKGKYTSDGGNLTGAVSAPIYGTMGLDTGLYSGLDTDDMMSEERKAVRQLVQQSLQSNMRKIAKRANLPPDFVPSESLRSLTSSSTSKSLTF